MWGAKEKYKKEVIIYLIVCIFLFLYMIVNWSGLKEEKVVEKQYWYDSIVTEELREDVWYIQPFMPLEKDIEDMHLSFYKLGKDSKGYIDIRLKDSQGNILSEKNVNIEDVLYSSNETEDMVISFSVLTSEMSLEKNEIYSIEFKVSDVEGAVPNGQFIIDVNEEEAGNLKYMQIGEEETEKFFYIAYQKYLNVTNYVPILLVILVVIGMVLFSPVNIVAKVIYSVFAISVPALGYVCMESLSGYLSEIEIQPAIYSVIMLYLVWGIGIAATNIKISTIFISIVCSVLGLANYFIHVFRGNSINAKDLWAIGTAAEVAGDYQYNVPVLFVCFLLLFAVIIAMVFKADLTIEKKGVNLYKKNGSTRWSNYSLCMFFGVYVFRSGRC